jgi:hypothetical protein
LLSLSADYILDGERDKVVAAAAEHPSADRPTSKGRAAALPLHAAGDHRRRHPLHPQAHRHQGGSNTPFIQIAARLKQIDAFYAKFALDERAKYVYSTRSLLSKILQQNNEFENIHDQEYSPAAMQTSVKGSFRENFAIESTSTRRKQPPQQAMTQINKNASSRSQYENSQRNIYLTEAEKDPKVMRLSDLKNQPKSKSPFSIREQPAKTTERGTSRKIEQGTSKKGTSRKI